MLRASRAHGVIKLGALIEASLPSTSQRKPTSLQLRAFDVLSAAMFVAHVYLWRARGFGFEN